MIFGNFNKTSRFIFYNLFFIFFSCNESDSIVLNPPNSPTFKVKSFMIDESSTSSRDSDFNTGSSPRSYIGFVDGNTESSLLIKIAKEIVSANELEVCDVENPNFKDINLNLILKKSLVDLGYDLSQIGENTPSEVQIINSNTYNGSEECVEPIYNWIYSEDLQQNECEQENQNGWIGETDHCGYIGQTNQCCKYLDCIACCQVFENCTNSIDDDNDTFIDCFDSDCEGHTSCSSISYDINNIFNAYILDDTIPEIENYEENSISNHQTDWLSNAILEELNVTIKAPYLISIDLYDYLTSQGIQNFCTLDSDIMILLRLNDLSSILFEPYIEIFSTDDSEAAYYSYKPYVAITYDELTDVTQEHKKYNIDNGNINFNTSLNSNNISYNIHNADSINIVAFSDNPMNTDCSCYQIQDESICDTCIDCNWNEDNCIYNLESNIPQLSPIINKGYSDELFNFDITIDETYLNLIELKDTLNDIIKFRFDNVYFIFQDEDPLNDDWGDYGSDGCDDEMEDGTGDCLSLQQEQIYDVTNNPDPNEDNYDEQNNPNGTQGNQVYDEGEGTESNFHYDDGEGIDNYDGEEFDDYGYDLCPDEYENGLGGCLCNANIEDDCENLDADEIVFNVNGYENNGIYDEGEYFDSSLDTGSDGCFNEHEDGNGYCIQNGEDIIYNDDPDDPEYNPDPNGDDFSLDPSGDNWNDYGSDGCPDQLENGNNGCFEEGEVATGPDPNGDNYDENDNIYGTQGNNSFDPGEGYEDNLQYDYDSELNKGEYWIDAGIDQLFDIHEPGYDSQTNPDPHGDNWNDCGQDGLCEGDYGWINSDLGEENGQWDLGEGREANLQYDLGEWYFDDGIDQLNNDNEYNIGYDDEGTENKNKYDTGEALYDIGSDYCPNIYESGDINTPCLCDYLNYLNDENDDSCDSITQIYGADNLDPNKDDFNVDPNGDNLVSYYENNGKWDFFDFGNDGCEDKFENGNQGCLEVELTEEELEATPDPNSDNYHADNNPSGTEGNEEFDYDFSVNENTFWEYGYGEKFETFYDKGKGDITENEEKYLANYALPSITPLFYINPINDLEINESFDGEKTNNPDRDIFLWINSITKSSENKYNVSVHLETFIDIIAFQIHLDHDYFEYTEEMMEEKSRGLWPYENNINNEGEKYILDTSIYNFDESFCTLDNEGCTSSDLLLSYGHGMKSNLAFKDTEDQYFYEFMEELQNSTQFTVFSDEYTKLLLYFDLSEGSLHNVDEFTEIKIEYLDEEEGKYKIFPLYYQSVTVNDDYIAIPIVYFMQSYLVGDLNIFDNSLEILLSASSSRFNFSKIAIDSERSRIEVFYSE